MKALKWNVFTDASARRLVVGQGEPLCDPWVNFCSFICWIFVLVNQLHQRKVTHMLDLRVCFKFNTSGCVLSSFCGSGSGFSRQGACGHLQGEKQVCLWWLLFYFIFMSNKSVRSWTRETRLTLFIFLLSGLICKVSAGNEMAFQTTSYLSALSSREHLLLPLVLGLRRWAQVRFHVSCWALCVFVCFFCFF